MMDKYILKDYLILTTKQLSKYKGRNNYSHLDCAVFMSGSVGQSRFGWSYRHSVIVTTCLTLSNTGSWLLIH
jgi:hypothetical protein